MLKRSIIKHITQGALTKNNMSFYIFLGSHYTYLYIMSRSMPMLASMNLLTYLCGIALKTVL